MAKGYGIKSFTVKDGEFEEQTFDRLGSAGMIPTLVASPEAPLLLTWNPTTHLTTISAVDGDDARPLEGMDSTNPVGGVWNTKRNCLSLAATVMQDKKANRIRIFNYKQDATKAWKLLDTIWIEGVNGNAAAGSRCQIVFDDTKDRGPNGGYNVYLKGNYPDPNQAGLNYLCRQIEDKTLSDGWRVKMMGNEWAFTRSVCSVAPHDGDVAYAMRWSDESLAVYMKASGIEDSVLTDFDEVSFICNTGFANSLRWVQNEQWPKLKGKR